MMKGENFNSESEYQFMKKDEEKKVEDVKGLKKWVARWAKEEAGAA